MYRKAHVGQLPIANEIAKVGGKPIKRTWKKDIEKFPEIYSCISENSSNYYPQAIEDSEVLYRRSSVS